MQTLIASQDIPREAMLPPIGAISVGMVNGKTRLDLVYEEDAHADMDLNVVMDATGRYVDVQGTAERTPVMRSELDALLNLASQGIEQIINKQREVLVCTGIEV
jgi:ribonuclease PH